MISCLFLNLVSGYTIRDCSHRQPPPSSATAHVLGTVESSNNNIITQRQQANLQQPSFRNEPNPFANFRFSIPFSSQSRSQSVSRISLFAFDAPLTSSACDASSVCCSAFLEYRDDCMRELSFVTSVVLASAGRPHRPPPISHLGKRDRNRESAVF